MDQLRAEGRMIEFACRCQYRFSLPEDQAGGMIQCPQCKRLVDIPNLSDLEHIDADGSFKMEEGIIPLAEPDRLQKLHKSFTRDHTDQDGSEIDLRPTMEDVLEAGSEEIPLELADEVLPGKPKYDPVTGELVRPIDVKPGEARIDPGAVPMAQRAIEYAGAGLHQGMGIVRIGFELLQPVNLFVMSIILLIHLLLQPFNLIMAAGIFLVVPVWIMGVMILVSHYGNVIEETGPDERDELPRPLRDASFYDDIWRPFTYVGGAFLLCWWPVLVAGWLSAPAYVGLILNFVAVFFFPAVLLTLATSGTSLNLRPDRVIGVIRACGGRYLTLVGLFVAADVCYGLGLWRFQWDSQQLFALAGVSSANIPWWFERWAAYPALIGGIYLMHWFCWSMGATYRAHRDQFPWVLQRHTFRRLRDRTALPPGARKSPNANSASVKQKLGA